MKGPVTNVVEAISGLVGRLTLPAREKRELELEITRLLSSLETVSMKNRMEVVRGEAVGTLMAAAADVGVRRDYSRRSVHPAARAGGHFPIVGFA